MESKYFLTVDWCSEGKRGIFSSASGDVFGSDTQHTEDEMGEILGVFSMILNPQSLVFTEAEVANYTAFYPLAEYTNHYGVVLPKGESDG
ncbi:hypothetical protein LCGC14_0386260 [marine sediment metagenome]|uniref:Uncharacterized protein n=1 Tax=marine sediment metagenome TaxID=412755 RepID=A0A0F9TJ23_9ZZZZ